jgi:hypothetical protein
VPLLNTASLNTALLAHVVILLLRAVDTHSFPNRLIGPGLIGPGLIGSGLIGSGLIAFYPQRLSISVDHLTNVSTYLHL